MEENEENQVKALHVKELRVKTLHKERMGFIRAGLSTGLVKTDSFRHMFVTRKCAESVQQSILREKETGEKP